MPLLRDDSQISSAYLATHVDNPVAWWSWGPDAFAEARERDVPVFLSVGYAACHWCHVMAHESFERADIAALLNQDFVAIKVDREERPDVDQVYMAATQLLTGHGGWPMSLFLLPDGRPFTAGTYYPPEDRLGAVGFPRLLTAIAAAWHERRTDVERQATEVQRALRRELQFVDVLAPVHEPLTLPQIRDDLRGEIASRTDQRGGSGAPRFPRPSYVRALLSAGDFDTADTILRAMAWGGLYDHIDGGFARYSVDAAWEVPHFEQMLSDQALLAEAYLAAARVTDTDTWRQVAEDTLDHVITTFRVPAGYASSLDADAAGVEGSHVTWTPMEVEQALSAAGLTHQLPAVLNRWSITTTGNLDGRSVPRLREGDTFITPDELTGALEALRQARGARPQPARDNKVILEWNAMLASAFLASGRADHVDHGLELLTLLAQAHFSAQTWWRTENQRTYAGAADVAWYANACVDAFELTGNDEWRARASDAVGYLLEHFWDGPVPTSANPNVGGGVFSNAEHVDDLFARPKDVFDGATPSSHAVSARAIARVALCNGDNDLLVVSQRLITLAAGILTSHPMSVVDTVEAARFALAGIEVVLPGPPNEFGGVARHYRMAGAVVITGSGTSPLLAGRQAGLAYVCQNGVCRTPVGSVEALTAQLQELTCH